MSKGAEDAAKAHGIAASAAERRKKKEAEEAAAREMAAMFAPAIKQPKPPPGAGFGQGQGVLQTILGAGFSRVRAGNASPDVHGSDAAAVSPPSSCAATPE